MPIAAPRTAASTSESAKMMFGLLPPSSSETFFTVSAAVRATNLPTSVDPVNEILSTLGCATSAAPAVVPGPGTTLKTPAGSPASAQISASARAVSGVCAAGFNTTVLPHASAGATCHVACNIGKFHGTIEPTTPSGSRSEYVRNGPVETGSTSPCSFVAQPAKY